MKAAPGLARQRGVVLVVALVLLAVFSMIAISAIRGSISTEVVGRAMRASEEAMQAAETALRHCEQQVLANNAAIPINDDLATDRPVMWETRAYWDDGAKAYTLPAAIVDSGDGAARKARTPPKCMVERYRLRTLRGASEGESYLVTAVGYTRDYAQQGGKTVAGGEVWLQSILRR